MDKICRKLLVGLLSFSFFFSISCKKKEPLVLPDISDQAFTIEENSPFGTVVDTISATSLNPAEQLFFKIVSSNEQDPFTINPISGELTVNNTQMLDYETQKSFLFEVSVESSLDPSIKSTATIIIDLIDQQAPVMDNLLTYYGFANDALDESGNQHDGVLSGNPVFTDDRNGKLQSAIYLDGLDDVVNLGLDSIFDLSKFNEYSISFWLKPTDSVFLGEQVILSKYNSASDTRMFKVGLRPDPTQELQLRLYDLGTRTNDLILSPYSLEWTHVVLVLSSTEVKMYVNNQLASTINKAVTLKQDLSNIPAYIGGVYYSSKSPDLFFKGSLDDFAFYNRILTESEISIMYNE